MARDAVYIGLIQSVEWRRLRMAKLRAAKGLCEDCLERGKLRAATEVHHVVPIQSGGDYEGKRRLAYDMGNLRCLCHACHQRAHDVLGSRRRGYVRGLLEARSREFLEGLGGKAGGTDIPGFTD